MGERHLEVVQRVCYSRECSCPAQRGYIPVNLATTVGEKRIDRAKNMSLNHCMTVY